MFLNVLFESWSLCELSLEWRMRFWYETKRNGNTITKEVVFGMSFVSIEGQTFSDVLLYVCVFMWNSCWYVNGLEQLVINKYIIWTWVGYFICCCCCSFFCLILSTNSLLFKNAYLIISLFHNNAWANIKHKQKDKKSWKQTNDRDGNSKTRIVLHNHNLLLIF